MGHQSSSQTGEPCVMPDRPEPPRSVRWFVGVYWTCLSAVGALVLWQLLTGRIRILFEGPWLAGVAMVVAALVIVYRFGRVRMARRFLNPHAGFVCPRCHYTLRLLPDVGACPECGTSYTRAGVVALWEETYRLGRRYPRSGPSKISSAPATAPAAPPSAPWKGASLRAAVERLEDRARKRGYASPRLGTFQLELEHGLAVLRRPIPSDLHTFLGWFDSVLWAHAVGGSGSVEERPPRTVGTPDAAVVVRHPSALRVVRDDGTAAAELLRDRAREEAIEFADTPEGRTIVYCTGEEILPQGRIAVIAAGASPRIIADSLAEWIMRIAMGGGANTQDREEDAGRVRAVEAAPAEPERLA